MKTKRSRGLLALTASLAVVLIFPALFLAGCGKGGTPETGSGTEPAEGNKGPRVINFWQPG